MQCPTCGAKYSEALAFQCLRCQANSEGQLMWLAMLDGKVSFPFTPTAYSMNKDGCLTIDIPIEQFKANKRLVQSISSNVSIVHKAKLVPSGLTASLPHIARATIRREDSLKIAKLLS